MWYPGRIRCAHLGGAEADSAEDPTFEVVYDDGEVEMHVRPEFLRQHVPGTICVGTRVLCRYDGGEEYYPGQVSDVQENGRYTIAYDDGEVEEDVPLDHILEPEEEKEEGAPGTEGEDEDEEEEASNQPTNEAAAEQEQQQQEEDEDEDAEMEEAKDSLGNLADGATSGADVAHDSEESVNKDVESDEAAISEPLEHFDQPRPEHSQYKVAFRPTRQNEDVSDPTPAGVSAERAYIIESLQLLEKRLGDASSTKSVLSTLVKQMRAYPQVTADLVHERGGERLVIDALKFHQSHAVIQCYGFVLLRRLCFLCVKSTHYLLRNGIVELVIQAMNAFAEDAILQASACGALAVFTRVHSGLNILIEYQVAQLVLSTLIYHKTYSVHTRQVHYYACEVLLELCELDDLQTLNMLCGEQEEEFTGDMSPISLFLFLLRQGLSLDDKKACCAVGSLLMCLAASGKRAAALILGFNGIAELSTVMASEFDDNGGDDEDMAAEGGVDADDPQIPVAETSDSPREVPLQESKSGEALYDDGYDEFDEDDTANAEDGEVAPAGIDSDLAAEVADVTSSEPLSGDSDQAATVIEIEGSDTPPLAPDNASTEGSRAGDESALPGGNVENNTEDGGDGGDMVNEPEELQEPRTEMADVANAANESPSDPDVLVYTTAEEQNGSASPELENNLVPDSSGESNAEGEQEPVTTAVEVDTADIHDTSDGVVEAENPGNVDEHAVVLDSEASTSTSVAELTVTEIEIVDTEPNFHSDAASGEAPATDVPGEPTDLVDHASEDILGCAVQLQQEEGESTEVTGTEAKVLLADNSASSLERDDEESKKLSADSSVVSIQSAAYDEENFDAEESHHEEEPSEAVNETNSIASPVEKVAEIAGELVDPEQEQGGENPSVSEIEVDAGTAQDVTFDADKDSEDGPNGLTTNSSELSVQSAAYEDDDFDDGAHEETGVAESEGQTLDQQPNVEEDTEVGETNVLAEAVISVDETPTAFGGDEEGPNTLDNEFPSEHSVVSGGEDFGNVALSELPKKNTTETSDTKMTGETSELQQVEHGNSTGASDSDVVEAPAVENDTPAAVHQDEAADEQQAADELDKYDDHPQMDILGEITAENATKSEDLTSECPIEEAKLPPDAVDSATVPSATNDTLASKSPEITIPADELTQEEAFDTSDTNEQPATYGDDDFDNGGEDEEVSPSVVTQDFDPVKGGEDPKDDDRDVHQASEQVSDEAGDLRSTEANAIDEPMVDPSEPESQTGDQQEQPDIETELVPVADDELAPGGIAGGLVLEAKSELDPAVSSGEVGDRVADDDSANLNSSNDEANRIAMEVAPPELGIDSSAEPDLQPAAPNEQVEEEERFQNEHEEAAEPEGAADFSTEEVPQPELESTNLAEPNEVDVTVESSANESEPSVEVATEDIVAEQAPEYTQGSDEFDEESPKSDPAPADTAAMVDNSAKLSEAAAHEEDQYGDANFDEVENDTAALKDVAPESALGQVDPGETEEIASADVANTAPGVYDEHEEPKIFANVEPDISCRINDALEPSEATAGMTGDQEVAVNDQFTGDTTPEATGNADDYLNDDTIMIPDANTQDGLPVSSPDAAACEENLLSDTLPGANEDVSIATSAYVEEVVDNDDKFAVGSNSSRIGSVANDIPVATADVSPESSADVDTVPISPPKDEGYGEGFDEANPPAANSSDPVDPTPSTEDTVANTDVSVPKNNVPLETPDDTVVAESDQLNEDEDVCDEDVPNAAKNFAQAEEEEKPEDCDTISSVNVEPIEGAVESDVVAPEASGVEATIPADSEMGSVEMVEPATAAESTDVETMSVEPDVAELAVVESDSAHEFIQFEAAESEAIEPEVMAVEEPQAVQAEAIVTATPEAAELEAVVGEEPEDVELEVMAVEEPQAVQTEAVVTTVPEAAEPEAVVGEEPEAVELEVVVAEEAEAVEPEAAQAVAAAEPEAAETVNSELAAVSGGELEAMEDVVVDAETAEVAAADPSVNESASVEEKEPAIEATESEAAPQDRRQSDDVESSPTADSTPASEFPLENTSAESPPGETTIPDAIKDKLSPEASETAVAADPVIGDSDNLSVNDEGGAVKARNDPTSIGDNEDASESKDDGCGEANSGKVKPDVSQIEEYADNSASAVPVGEDSPEVIATEVPGHVERDISVPGHVEHDVGVEADAPTSDTSPAIQENADPPESIYTDDVDANDDQGALDVVQNTGEVAANATSEEEEPVTEVANPEPAEVPGEAQPVAEEQTPVQADDYDADPPVDEPPASPLVETTPADAIQAEAVEEEAPSTQNFAAEAQPDASADVDVRESPEKLAVEVIESQPDELAVESSAVAASEGPATEDQYDDEDGYNDFDDQENDAPTPSVEIPAPSAAVTEAPATEDDYEEFENEDYGDEEKPAAEMSARREPPPSAREEEIEEVADEADEAEEEAYADDPDDYNNEFEDDDAPAAAPKASSPKKDQPTAAADASADEYEDDAEDEYAEDEVEESSPKAAAPRQPAAKSNSDDEMEEELGSDYAESDG
ncbi:Armadillo-type fold [Phytophthora cinnamomi]|uniref:Armadillo-type fold n=1 Tax=Phytophthora cinnamomi TaxID=4785 RepID=UPI003559BAAA|nr:Armadillo-type fold [Phytophthora cinnamomi]